MNIAKSHALIKLSFVAAFKSFYLRHGTVTGQVFQSSLHHVIKHLMCPVCLCLLAWRDFHSQK